MTNLETHEPNNLPLWVGATILVLSVYAGLGFWASAMRGDPNVVRGGQEAIMLEFAEEPMAPETKNVSEVIKEETVQEKEEEKVEPKEEEAKPEPEPQKSEMVEEVKKPEPKKEVKKPKVEARKVEPKKDVKKADVSQKASGPEIVAKKGPTYAAPTTNRVFGGDGRLVSSCAKRISCVTPVTIAGSINSPPSLFPPQTSLPPFFKASAMWSSTFFSALSSIIGPISVSALRPSPIFNALTACSSFFVNAS